MRIAHVLSTCVKSGPFIVSRDIINNIPDNAHEIDVYYLKETADPMNFNAKLIKTELWKKTDFSSYDVIHSHGFLGDLYASLNHNSIKKWICTLHQKIKPDYSMSYNLLVGFLLQKCWVRLLKNAHLVVTLTAEMAEYYTPYFKPGQVTYVYNGVSEFEAPKLPPGSERDRLDQLRRQFKILGISANLVYRKGIDQVIQNLSNENAKDLALLVVGDGPQRAELETLAKQGGVENRCFFVGFKPDPIGYFPYFDVYMMSSRSEGFGLCVLEAASQKIPIVCNDLSVYRELFGDEVVRFDLKDPISMITSVRQAITHRIELSQKGYQKFRENYTVAIMAGKYFELYKT